MTKQACAGYCIAAARKMGMGEVLVDDLLLNLDDVLNALKPGEADQIYHSKEAVLHERKRVPRHQGR